MEHRDLWTLDELIEAYKQHQRRTRGLREQTLRGYERLARLFVRAALGDDPLDPTHCKPHDVVERCLVTWRVFSGFDEVRPYGATVVLPIPAGGGPLCRASRGRNPSRRALATLDASSIPER